MRRPRTAIGTFGQVYFLDLPRQPGRGSDPLPDWDGKPRIVSARADSRSAAEAELKKRLAERNGFQPVDTTLTLDSLFPELVAHCWATWIWRSASRPRRGATTRTTWAGW
ncbi:MAG: hypothetical protein ACRD0W_05985 [Acidimicrobiales bacterium]